MTYSPWLMLRFGVSLDFKLASKCLTPLRNSGFNLSLSVAIFFITFGSDVGDGRAKNCQPEKNSKMLCATRF